MTQPSELLTEAQAAYHDLLIGRSAVRVQDADGSMILYQPSDAPKLAAYIISLQQMIAARKPILAVRFQTSKGL